VDGNKRTGLEVADTILRFYGYRLMASQEEKKDFVLSVAIEGWSVDRIVKWLRVHASKTK